jgi:hypothetical protein
VFISDLWNFLRIFFHARFSKEMLLKALRKKIHGKFHAHGKEVRNKNSNKGKTKKSANLWKKIG